MAEACAAGNATIRRRATTGTAMARASANLANPAGEPNQGYIMRYPRYDHRRRTIQLPPIGALLLMALSSAGCAKGAGESRSDSAGLVASGGVRADSGAAPMRVSEYSLTRERLDDWRGAQRSLSTMPRDADFVPVRAGDEVSSAEIDRAVAYLESRSASRRAIEETGLSVRDYVLTALALESARALRAGLSSRPLPANLALASEYDADLLRARRSSGMRVVDYDDDGDTDRDRDEKRNARARESDSDSEGGRGRENGKGRGKWKNKS